MGTRAHSPRSLFEISSSTISPVIFGKECWLKISTTHTSPSGLFVEIFFLHALPRQQRVNFSKDIKDLSVAKELIALQDEH
jgi:hypothetical protein